MIKSLRLVVAGPVLAMMAGCSLLAAQPDASRFFTLAATTAGTQATSDTRTTYGLGPISTPSYLDRNEMALRISPTEISYSPTDRWAEPLANSISRVLLQNLSVQLPSEHVSLYPWDAAQAVDYQVRVDVLRFEADASGVATLLARWRIVDLRLRQRVADRTATFTRTAENTSGAELSAALSAALASMTEELAADLRQLPAPARARTR